MRYLLILTFFFCFLSAHAVEKMQPTDEPASFLSNDKVFVDLSQHVFVSGQNLNYKAYVVNTSCPNNISTSKILYLEIIDYAHQKVLTWRCNVINGLANGSISIPDTISGGLYHLRAFTSWMRNFGTDKFFSTPVIITHLTDHKLEKLIYPANNTISLKLKASKDSIISNKTNNEPGTDGISVHLAKNTYKRNEKVRIEFLADIPANELVNLSVSVFENSNLEKLIITPAITDYFQSASETSSFSTNNADAAEKIPSSMIYPMESVGFALSGTLLNDSTNKPIVEVPIFLSKIDSTVQFKYDKTDSEGKFGFLANRDFDNHQLILQIPKEVAKNNYKWVIDNKWENIDLLSGYSNYQLSQLEEDELENIRKTELIKKLYQKSNNKNTYTQKVQGNSFYFSPDYIIKPSDYEELEDFNEISANILPLVKFKKTRNGYSFYMVLDELYKMTGFPPGLFLDGIPFFNLEYIASFNSNDIDRVEVCKHPIMYADQTYYGIVSIFTNSIKLKPEIFRSPIHKIDNKVVEESSSENNMLINRQTVFFTPCIYWNPDITIAGNKTVVIEFDTPNIETEYQVSINGIASKAIPYSKTIIFKIEN